MIVITGFQAPVCLGCKSKPRAMKVKVMNDEKLEVHFHELCLNCFQIEKEKENALQKRKVS